MKTLMVRPVNEKQEKALKAVFDALEVNYTEEKKPSKKQLLNELTEAVQEVNLIKAGKLKGINARELLNEL